MHALLTFSRLASLTSLLGAAAAAGGGAVEAALIAGGFMLVNTLLTVYLTIRLQRKDEAPRRSRRRR